MVRLATEGLVTHFCIVESQLQVQATVVPHTRKPQELTADQETGLDGNHQEPMAVLARVVDYTPLALMVVLVRFVLHTLPEQTVVREKGPGRMVVELAGDPAMGLVRMLQVPMAGQEKALEHSHLAQMGGLATVSVHNHQELKVALVKASDHSQELNDPFHNPLGLWLRMDLDHIDPAYRDLEAGIHCHILVVHHDSSFPSYQHRP